jgi:hypothetical protein
MEAVRARMSDEEHWPAHVIGRHGVVTPDEKSLLLKEITEYHSRGQQPLISWLVYRVLFFLL